jgi:hypothetical protein
MVARLGLVNLESLLPIVRFFLFVYFTRGLQVLEDLFFVHKKKVTKPFDFGHKFKKGF